MEFAAPKPLARYIARKGSVTLDGVSLTVNDVDGSQIQRQSHSAHARSHHARSLAVGVRVNLEIDLLARYVERLSMEHT